MVPELVREHFIQAVALKPARRPVDVGYVSVEVNFQLRSVSPECCDIAWRQKIRQRPIRCWESIQGDVARERILSKHDAFGANGWLRPQLDGLHTIDGHWAEKHDHRLDVAPRQRMTHAGLRPAHQDRQAWPFIDRSPARFSGQQGGLRASLAVGSCKSPEGAQFQFLCMKRTSQ